MGKALHQKRKINLKLAIYILVITTILALITSVSKFGETYTGSGNAIVAVPVLETATITLENINPQMSTIEYDLIVQNNKENQVTLNYIIKVNNIGNVPLDIKIYKYDTENDKIIGENLLIDGQTEPITIPIEEKVNTYKLEISWDKTKENYDNYLYSGETSYLEIKVDAVQKD